MNEVPIGDRVISEVPTGVIVSEVPLCSYILNSNYIIITHFQKSGYFVILLILYSISSASLSWIKYAYRSR